MRNDLPIIGLVMKAPQLLSQLYNTLHTNFGRKQHIRSYLCSFGTSGIFWLRVIVIYHLIYTILIN